MSNPTGNTTISDEDARKALEQGDNQKIDRILDELNVSTTSSGEDQTAKPDTKGQTLQAKISTSRTTVTEDGRTIPNRHGQVVANGFATQR